MTLGAIAAILIIKWSADATYFRGYDPDLHVVKTDYIVEQLPGYTRETFSINSFRGQTVPIRLAKPSNATDPLPTAIFLHGIGQSQDFLDEIAQPYVDAGFLFITFDQYDRGLRRPPKKVRGLRAAVHLRRRVALTVIETRRLIDYLETRQDVATDRIYLVGASFGAITGSSAAAMDTRVKAAVLTYGGANLRLLFGGEAIRNELGPLQGIAKEIAAWYLAPGDPCRHIQGLVGRPILFQNGFNDVLIPTASAVAFHNAAPEPKTIIWYHSDHVGLDAAHVDRVIADTIVWLLEQDGRPRPTTESPSPARPAQPAGLVLPI